MRSVTNSLWPLTKPVNELLLTYNCIYCGCMHKQDCTSAMSVAWLYMEHVVTCHHSNLETQKRVLHVCLTKADAIGAVP